MKKSRYFGVPDPSSNKGQFWRIAAFSILAAMLLTGVAGNLFVQNAYAANTLVVNAMALDGKVLNMWTTISSAGGSVVRTGHTPLTFVGTTGATYTVTVSNYGTISFDHWDNGSTSRSRTIVLNADTTLTASYRTTSTHNLVVSSVDSAGNASQGYYTVIRSGSATVRTGFTSLSFAGNHGTSYSVTVSDYGNMVFDHWNDGSTSRTRTVVLNADMTITAHYRNNAPGHTLTINSVGPSGGALTGYYTTIREGTATVKTGFTPLAHLAKSGATLVATVSDYGTMVFDRWEDGSTARSRTVTMSKDTTITAHYRDESRPTYTLTINSADMAGVALSHGVTIQSGSTQTGTTPWAVTGAGGTTYTVTPIDGEGRVFDHWESGSSERSRTIILGVNTAITAHYRVAGPNNSPSAANDSVTTSQGAAVTVNVLANDSDPDGNSLAVASTTDPANGSAAISGTAVTYTPDVGFAGTDTFDYTLSDGNEGTDVATVTVTVTPADPTGVFVALYMYPGGSAATHWQKVIDEKTKHPSVPIVAAFNPSSGPGNAKDNNIANWVNKLKAAGVVAIGYTYDDYGARSLSALRADADKYKNWYNADGLFIDEFTNKAGFENHYKSVTDYAKSLGMKMTMGNPGTDVPRSYIGTVDVINITEGRGYMPISWLQYCINCSASNGWHYQYDKRNFAYIRYDISTLDTAFQTESAKWVGLLYIHSGNDSNGRWFSVPPYFSTLVETLDR